jgi:ribonuclease III
MELHNLQSSLGYSFQQEGLIKKALLHRSLKAQDSYERLEYLGDSLLNSIVSYWLYLKSDCSEGVLSQKRALLVCESALCEYAEILNISKYIQCSPEIANSPSIIADSFEAICAAIFLDSDWKTTFDWVEKKLSHHFERIITRSNVKDFKTVLQEYTQGLRNTLPVYTLCDQLGSKHQPTFQISCHVGNLMTLGVGPSKKHAQQQAAQKMLVLISQCSSEV